MNAASAGLVLSISEGCARVEVTAVFNPYDTFGVGDIIGGTIDLACRPLQPVFNAGDEVLFQSYPGRTDECPAYRQCVDASCIGVDDACRKARKDSTLGVCTDPAAWSLQTGRFSALLKNGEDIAFHFAGQDREASISELTAQQCWADHFEILKEPGAAAAWERDLQTNEPDPSYDAVQCFQADEQ